MEDAQNITTLLPYSLANNELPVKQQTASHNPLETRTILITWDLKLIIIS
jgi:hypothetical protein